MSAVAKAGTQQNQLNFSDLVTQDPAGGDFACSFDTHNLPVDPGSTLSTPELDPKKREQSQLASLTQGVRDLSGYHHRQAAALASSLSDTFVAGALAPMTEALNGIKGGVAQLTEIFKEAATFSVTQELAQSAQGLIAEVRQHLANFATEAEKFKGNPAKTAANAALDLSSILSELAKSPTIDPAKQQPKQPESPLGSIDVTPPNLPQNLGGFGPIDAIAETFRSEQDFSRAWADALVAQRQEQFAKLVAGSKDAPLDIERPRRDLQGESIVSHLEKTNPELVASIRDAEVALAEKDREYTSAHKRAETFAVKVQSLHDKHRLLSSEIQAGQDAIKRLQEASTPEAGSSGAAQAQNDKKPGLWARVKAVAARFMRGSPADHVQAEKDAAAIQRSEELDNLKSRVSELTAETAGVRVRFETAKSNLDQAIEARDSVDTMRTQLHAKLSAAKEALQDALRQTCKDLHFTLPQDTTSPVTEALVKISIPVTTDTIPSIDSVLDREYLEDLGAKVEEKDGGVSLTHQVTGKSITIARRSSHGLDATLTVTDADGKQVASNRIWNDDLKKLVDHFLRTGNAPVREKQVTSWKVGGEAAAPETSRSENAVHPYLGVSTRAAQLVGFLKDGLTAAGYDVKAPGSDVKPPSSDVKPPSSDDARVVSNRLAISHSVNDVATRVTALLDKNTLKWSLFIEGAQQVALTTLAALDKVVEYFSKEPTEPKTEPETGEQPTTPAVKYTSV